jgi:hypothetical protein
MPNSEQQNLSIADNIWLTSKARVHAEKRYKKYSLISHLLLSYYALLMIFLTIFSESFISTLPLSQISIALSVSVFAASLIVYGFKFGETAQLHRECYLRLDKLLALENDNQKLKEQYHEIIAGYPNHSDNDFDDLVVDRVIWRKAPLNNSKGPISFTVQMLAWKIVRWFSFWLIFICLLYWPSSFLFSAFMEQQ